MHERTSFITLTINDQNLWSPHPGHEFAEPHRDPALAAGVQHSSRTHARTETRTHGSGEHASLQPRELTLFTKRLNEHARRKYGKGVRYYACGEYGERSHRPHYHIALFGEDFRSDRVFWKNTLGGHRLYRSKQLAALWTQGTADIGELTFESAAYVARYVMKKINGDAAHDHYKRIGRDGQEYWLEPEFVRMSRRPGLGLQWLYKNHDSVYPHDRVIVRGKPSKPPRYYDQHSDPVIRDQVKAAREAALNPESNTPERLRAGEAILTAALSQRNRPLEK